MVAESLLYFELAGKVRSDIRASKRLAWCGVKGELRTVLEGGFTGFVEHEKQPRLGPSSLAKC